MDRENALYELAHFAVVIVVAYGTLFAVRAVAAPSLWQELLVMSVVGITYVLAVLALGIAPPSWRGDGRSESKD